MAASETYHVGRECRDKLIRLIEKYEEIEEERSLIFFIRAKIIDALTGIDQPYPDYWREGDLKCVFDIDQMKFIFTFFSTTEKFTLEVSLQKLLKVIYGVTDAHVLAAVLTLTHQEHEALAQKIQNDALGWLQVQRRNALVEAKKLQDVYGI